MSTYTDSTYIDLHDKVNESINVRCHKGYPDDRTTKQEVKFLNDKNLYHGTFKGKIDSEGTIIANNTLSNVTLVDSTLSGKIILPSGVDLTKIDREIANLNNEVDYIKTEQQSQYTTLDGKIAVEADIRRGADKYLSGCIDAVDKDAAELSNTLSVVSTDFYLTSADFNRRIYANANSIADIYSKIKGALSFKGLIDLDIFSYDEHEQFRSTQCVSNLFFNNFWHDLSDVMTEEQIERLELSAGYYWLTKATINPLSTFIFEDLSTQRNDWLIIKRDKVLNQLSCQDVCVFDAQDVDVFHLSANNIINGNNKYYGLQEIQLANLETANAKALSASYMSATNVIIESASISSLSCNQSIAVTDIIVNQISSLSANICTAGISTIIATDVYADNQYISSQTASSLTATNANISTETVNSLTSTYGTITQAWVTDLTVTNINNVNLTATNSNVSDETVCNLSATNLTGTSACISALTATSTTTTNLTGTSANISSSNILTSNISDATIQTLSAANVSVDFECISSASISNSIINDLSITSLSNLSILDKVKYKSDDPTKEVEYISTLQDVLDLSVCNIRTEVSDISTFIYDDHYYKTMSTDITCTHGTESKVVDQLLILDEMTFDTYRLTIRNGALNINLVEKYES